MTKEERIEEYVDKNVILNGLDKEGVANFKQLVKDVCIKCVENEIAELGEHCLQLQKDKGNLTDRVKELEAQIEKLIDFVLSKIECCDVCPITDTCINSEGTCPYAGILAKGEEEVTREWLMQSMSVWIID